MHKQYECAIRILKMSMTFGRFFLKQNGTRPKQGRFNIYFILDGPRWGLGGPRSWEPTWLLGARLEEHRPSQTHAKNSEAQQLLQLVGEKTKDRAQRGKDGRKNRRQIQPRRGWRKTHDERMGAGAGADQLHPPLNFVLTSTTDGRQVRSESKPVQWTRVAQLDARWVHA